MSEESKIMLTENEFKMLVGGGIVDDELTNTKIALKDIGHDRMIEIVQAVKTKQTTQFKFKCCQDCRNGQCGYAQCVHNELDGRMYFIDPDLMPKFDHKCLCFLMTEEEVG